MNDETRKLVAGLNGVFTKNGNARKTALIALNREVELVIGRAKAQSRLPQDAAYIATILALELCFSHADSAKIFRAFENAKVRAMYDHESRLAMLISWYWLIFELCIGPKTLATSRYELHAIRIMAQGLGADKHNGLVLSLLAEHYLLKDHILAAKIAKRSSQLLSAPSDDPRVPIRREVNQRILRLPAGTSITRDFSPLFYWTSDLLPPL